MPACEGLVPVAATLCTHCGLNFETGRRVNPAMRDVTGDEQKLAALKRARTSAGLDAAPPPPSTHTKGFTCPSCGYDVTGLGGHPCPECGYVRTRRGDRELERKRNIESYWRTSWLIAGIGLPVGIALTVLLGMQANGYSMIRSLVHVGSCEVGLFVGYFVVGLFIGFEEDIRGLALRLVGIAAIWSGLWMMVAAAPLPALYVVAGTGMVTAITLAVPMQVLTGRDWDDCFWLAFGAWVAKTGVWMVLYYSLPDGW
ncbi:MAG: hypothetical protein QM783_03955 [Phycisphaerales bacterium]